MRLHGLDSWYWRLFRICKDPWGASKKFKSDGKNQKMENWENNVEVLIKFKYDGESIIVKSHLFIYFWIHDGFFCQEKFVNYLKYFIGWYCK